MDRSFLSRPEVVAASRGFVCVRLMTYESPAEADFLKSFHVTRSGELENTVFAVLTPDGKRQLARASRSARQTFGDAAAMAEALNRIARSYPAKSSTVPELPRVTNVRLGVNVAAADNRPLVVLSAPNELGRRALEGRLAPLAWSEPYLGQFIYVAATDAKDLARLAGAGGRTGVLIVQSDRFGLKGKVVCSVGPEASSEELAACLREGLAAFEREEKSFGSHVRDGRQNGVLWQTVLPVTDPMERRARERGRGLE